MELLVVISIISLLFGLLLPTLSAARESALRAKCGAERRQLILAMFQWGLDNRDLYPTATGTQDGAGYTGLAPDIYPNWHRSYFAGGDLGMMSNRLNLQNGYNMMPMITMARKSYLDDPRMLFCPSFGRTQLRGKDPATYGSLIMLFLDQMPNNWRIITRGDLNLRGTALNGDTTFMGIVTHPIANRTGVWAESLGQPNVRFEWILTNARLRATLQSFNGISYTPINDTNNNSVWGVSPILASCANYNTQTAATSAAAAVAFTDINSGTGVSHYTLGLNAGMIDGSVKWITRDQVIAKGYVGGGTANTSYNTSTGRPFNDGAYMYNTRSQGNPRDNFHSYARIFDGD